MLRSWLMPMTILLFFIVETTFALSEAGELSDVIAAKKAARLAELHARKAEILSRLADVEDKLHGDASVLEDGAEPAAEDAEDGEDKPINDDIPVEEAEGPQRSFTMHTEGYSMPAVTTEASCHAAGVCGRYVTGNPCQCTNKCHYYGNCCPDYEKVCNGYMPKDPALLSPSPAPLQTFYMYRAQSDVSYPPLNANMASLSGVLWYLQNEVVNRCDSGRGSGTWGYRRFKITRILRYKVQLRATTPLYKLGMTFGSRVAFDFGKNTGAFEPWYDKKYNYDVLGYNVGCSKLGDKESSPYPKCPSSQGSSEHFCPVKYAEAYWYSMPGACPEQDIKHKSARCQSRSPGGYCKGIPTGQGNCTWTYEDAGEIDIDELVGIKEKFGSHYAFCKKGCLEYQKYGYYKDKGKCINWWDHRMDDRANRKRMDDVDAFFKKKYPNMPSENEFKIPKCDFKKGTFYSTLKYHRR
eukprot:TRINITY_DN12553_c0_g1_i1.p1 TRINITY_DN12553_c0_g1~~TRINITY_DN12553_c0_g1_i1.p1  ORF type:complete len:466 (-),score=117.24 TRINITY_DN12553_c0_g1_i1:126-1523(-)